MLLAYVLKMLSKMTKTSLRGDYDSGADVLYLSTQQKAATRCNQEETGLFYRYDGDVLIGITVLNFHNVWMDKIDQLLMEVSTKFQIPKSEVEAVLYISSLLTT